MSQRSRRSYPNSIRFQRQPGAAVRQHKALDLPIVLEHELGRATGQHPQLAIGAGHVRAPAI